jgi:hypothetical protein
LFNLWSNSLSCRRSRRKLILFHKIHNNIVPEYLNDCLNEYLVDNNYNPRNSLQYRVPRCRLETFSKSFFPSTIRLWNSLEPNFKSMQITSKIKQTLRGNLLKVSNYYIIGSRKWILWNKISFRRLRLQLKVSQPVSTYMCIRISCLQILANH